MLARELDGEIERVILWRRHKEKNKSTQEDCAKVAAISS